eukprot:1699487-Prymnesium_polylepis.2
MLASFEPWRDSSFARSTTSPESSAMWGARYLVSPPFSPHSVEPAQGRFRSEHGNSARHAQAAVVAQVKLHEGAVVLERAMERSLKLDVLAVKTVVGERKLCERRISFERCTDVYRPRSGDI